MKHLYSILRTFGAFALLLFLFLLSAAAYGQTVDLIYGTTLTGPSAGTPYTTGSPITIPSWLSSTPITVELWGGGGGGGGAQGGSGASSGAGGGGGGYVTSTITGGGPYSFSIGAGGAYGVNTGGTGGTGGSTTFTGLTTATGGSGGAGSTNGYAAGNALGGTGTYSGGTGAAASSSGAGGGGAGGNPSGTVNNGGTPTGGAAVASNPGPTGSCGSGNGKGGNGATNNSNAAGSCGSLFGGGGGGGSSKSGSGNKNQAGEGGNGGIRLTYTMPASTVSSISPSSTYCGVATPITITGYAFMDLMGNSLTSVAVQVNGSTTGVAMGTVTQTSVTFTYTPSSTGTFPVTVVTTAPGGGGTSNNNVTLTVNQISCSLVTTSLTTVGPTALSAGSWTSPAAANTITVECWGGGGGGGGASATTLPANYAGGGGGGGAYYKGTVTDNGNVTYTVTLGTAGSSGSGNSGGNGGPSSFVNVANSVSISATGGYGGTTGGSLGNGGTCSGCVSGGNGSAGSAGNYGGGGGSAAGDATHPANSAPGGSYTSGSAPGGDNPNGAGGNGRNGNSGTGSGGSGYGGGGGGGTNSGTLAGAKSGGSGAAGGVVVTYSYLVANTSSPYTSSQTICTNTAPAPMAVSVSGGTGGTYMYAWSVNGSAITNATNSTYIPTSITATGTYKYVCSVTDGCGTVTSNTATVTVVQAPTLAAQGKSICSGSSFTYSPSGSNLTGVSYTWSAPTFSPGGTGSVTGSNGANSNSGNTYVFDNNLVNATSVAQIASYIVTPTGPCGVASPFTLTVSISPVPSLPSQLTSVCSGVAFSYTPTGPVLGNTYTWSGPSLSGGVSGGGSGSGSAISNTLTNSTSGPTTTIGRATYTVTSSYSGCPGNVFTLSVTVGALTGTLSSGINNFSTPGSGTYTVPANTSQITVQAWGGGGGGGGAVGCELQDASSGGGGGGGYAAGTIILPVGPYSYYVGAGGSGGSASGSGNGSPGTASYFISATTSSNPYALYAPGGGAGYGGVDGSGFCLTTETGGGGSASGAGSYGSGLISAVAESGGSGGGGNSGAAIGSGGGGGGAGGGGASPSNGSNGAVGGTYTLAGAGEGGGGGAGGGTGGAPGGTSTTYLGDAGGASGTGTGGGAGGGGTTTVGTTGGGNGGAPGGGGGGAFSLAVTAESNSGGTGANGQVSIGYQTVLSSVTDPIICLGTVADTLGVQLPATSSGTYGYQWYSNTGSGWNSINTNGTNNFYAPGAISTTTSYYCQISSSCGTTNSNIVTITVPNPTISSQSVTTCSQTVFTYSPTASTTILAGTTITYSWAAPTPVAGLTGLVAGSAQSNLNFTVTNTTNGALSAEYVMTPTIVYAGLTCTGVPFTVTATINPTPVLAAQSVTYCSPATFSYTPTGTVAGPSFTYAWSHPGGSGYSGSNGASSATGVVKDNLTNTTSVAETATYSVTPTGSPGGCPGSTFTVSVVLNPSVIITAAQTTSTCSNVTFSYTPSGIIPSGTVYAWSPPSLGSGLSGGSSGTATGIVTDLLHNTTSVAATATYNVTPTSPPGTCRGTAFTVTVTVNPAAIITSQATSACSNSNFSFTPTGTIPTGTTYAWNSPSYGGAITGGSSGSGQTTLHDVLYNTTSVAATATYSIVPTTTTGSCAGTPFTVTVTVNPAAIISGQSTSTCSMVAFTYTPAGTIATGTTYAWASPGGTGYTGGTSGAAGQTQLAGDLDNTTTATVIATYIVTPSSSGCTGSIFTVSVDVNPTPVLVSQSTSVCSATAFTYTPIGAVAASDFTYAWSVPTLGTGLSGGSSGSATGIITDDLTNITNSPVTATYVVTPTGSPGGCVGSPFTLTATVNPTPVISSQATTVCSRSAFSYTPTGTIVASTYTYAWAAPGGSGFSGGASGSATNMLTADLTNTTTSPVTATYAVTPSGSPGGCAGTPFTLSVTVNPTPELVAQSTSTCSAVAFTYTPTGTVAASNFTYAWAPPTGSGFTGSAGGQTELGILSDQLTNTTNAAVTATYTVTPTGAPGGCTGAVFTVRVEVDPVPVLHAQSTSVCSQAAFSYTPTGTIVASSYTYAWAAPGGSGFLNGSSGSATGKVTGNLTNSTASVVTATYSVYPSGSPGGCAGTPFTVSVAVNPAPLLVAQSTTACSGTAYTYTPTGTVVYGTYAWAAPSGLGFAGGQAAAGQSALPFKLTNNTTSPVTAVYTLTPSASHSCTGTPFTVSVTVNPTPVLSSQATTYCSQSAFSYTPHGTIAAADFTYAWSLPGGTGFSGSAGGQSGLGIVNDDLTNTTSGAVTATYVVTPSGSPGGCVGTPFTVSVTLDPTPVLPSQATTVCSQAAISYTPTGTTVTGTYSWASPTGSGFYGGAAANAQSSLHFLLTNTTTNPVTATYTVTPSGYPGGCRGTAFTVSVTVNPAPILTNQSPRTCSGSAFTYTPTGTVVIGTYAWGVPSGSGFSGSVGGQSGQTSINDDLINTTALAVIATYTVTPAAGGCTGTVFRVAETVYPTPLLPSQSVTLCSGQYLLYSPTGTIVSSNYSWAAPSGSGFSGGASGGSQTSMDIRLTNTTAGIVTAIYTVTPSGSQGGCVGSTFTVSVVLNPVPVLPSQTTTTCSGTVFSYSPTGTIVTGTYAWSAPTGGGYSGGAGAQSGQSTLTDELTNTTNVAANAYYAVTPSTGVCAGTPFRVTVILDPTSATTENVTICSYSLPYTWNGFIFNGSGSQTAHFNNRYGCDSASTLVLTVNSTCPNEWTGNINTDWSNAGNWTTYVPTSTTDGLIPAGRSNYPVIVTAPASVRNLTIESHGSVTIPTGYTLNVYGNWTDSGTASVGPGTVKLSGSQDYLYGSTAFGNLTIAGNAEVGTNTTDKISVSGILTTASGTLKTNNKLTLVSTANQTAIIVDNGGTILGNATIERYVGGSTGYHHISSPVSGATLANLSGFTISGTNGVGAFVRNYEGSLQEYIEALNTSNTLDSGYYNYTSPSNPLTSGQGLTALIIAGSTISFYGPPTTGGLSYDITDVGTNANTAGWNFIGNPYPSPISWTLIQAANVGVMNGTCYIWKPSGTGALDGVWEAYNGYYGIGGADDAIALAQGFFVLKNTTGTTGLSFDNSMRYNSLTTTFYKTNLVPDEIRLTLTQGIDTAEILSYTEAGRSLGYDQDVDGILPPFTPGNNSNSIAFAIEGQKYLINVFDKVSENTELPLAIHTAVPGTYTISATALNINSYPVYLLDKAANTYYNLMNENVSFTSPGNEDRNNYSVVFKKASAVQAGNGFTLENLYPNPATSQISAGIISYMNATATVTMTDVLGRVVMAEEWPITVGYNVNQFDISKFAEGAYTVTISSGDITTSRKMVIAR